MNQVDQVDPTPARGPRNADTIIIATSILQLLLFLRSTATPSSLRSNLPMRCPTDQGTKSSDVPRLHKHSARPRKFTHQAFTGGDAADDASTGDALEDVLAIPGHEVAVVNDVFLTVEELGCTLEGCILGK